MNYKRATRIYKENTETTITNIEFVLLLLNEIKKSLHEAKMAHSNTIYREEIQRTQTFLFELMAVSNRGTIEGERLFSVYIYLNQLSLRIAQRYDEAIHTEIERAILQIEQAWIEAQQQSRIHKAKTNLL